MRPIKRLKLLRDILGPERLTNVVDIGANPINGRPPYALLRRAELCHVTGFEPDPTAFSHLSAMRRDRMTILPDAVGDGAPTTLYVNVHSGLTSTLPLEPWVGDYLGPYWAKAQRTAKSLTVPTRRLDDVDQIKAIDFLKIDIQGGELAVFQNARHQLAKTAMIQTEAALLPYYAGQPTLGDQQAELASQGFVPYRLAEVNRHRVAYDQALGRGVKTQRSQVLDVDVIFLRDPIRIAELEDETLKHMTLLADAVLGAYDLVLRCLGEAARRRLADPASIDAYTAELARLTKAASARDTRDPGQDQSIDTD